MGKVTLNVNGMKCGGCEKSVEDILKGLNGIEHAKASSKDATVELEFQEDLIQLDQVKKVLNEKGYPAL
jgi:copper chaperone CopZ